MVQDLWCRELSMINRETQQLARPTITVPGRVAEDQPAAKFFRGQSELQRSFGWNTVDVGHCSLAARGDRYEDGPWFAKYIRHAEADSFRAVFAVWNRCLQCEARLRLV